LVPNSALPSAPTVACRAHPCAATVTCGRRTQPGRAPVVTMDRPRPRRQSEQNSPSAVLVVLGPRPPTHPASGLAPLPVSKNHPIPTTHWRLTALRLSRPTLHRVTSCCSLPLWPHGGACAGRQSFLLSSPFRPLATRTPRHGIRGPAYCGTRAQLHGLDRRCLSAGRMAPRRQYKSSSQ
jgi:hypothetical protein